MYKLSNYSVFTETEEGLIIINTYTGAVGKIDVKVKNALNQELFDEDSFDNLTLKKLRQNGFIVPKEQDEYQKIIDKEQSMIYEKSKAQCIVIAPTLQCNYNCEYCFEDGRRNNNSMTPQIVEAVVNYVKNHLFGETKELKVIWFGGEPLLKMDLIREISKELIKVCNKKRIMYHAHIVTNGYFLTNEIAKEISEEYGIRTAQITLDGPVHIYERIKQTPMGAYNKVLDNIVGASKFMNICIRLNITPNYYPYLLKYVDELMEIFRDCPTISIYLAEIRNDWKESGLEKEESNSFWKMKQQFESYVSTNYQNRLTNKDVLCFSGPKCGLVKKNNYIIGPQGELYRCEHMVGLQEGIIGTCFEGRYHNRADVVFNFMEYPKKCHECKVFPICMGGCPHDVL